MLIQKKKVAVLGRKAELKVEKDKILKLQESDSSYCRGKSHFKDHSTENYLLVQLMHRYFKKVSINSDHISSWTPKGLSEGSIKFPSKFNNCLAPALSYFGNKTKVKFDGSSLKQDKITFTHGNIINIHISYKINLWPKRDDNFTLTSALFGDV